METPTRAAARWTRLRNVAVAVVLAAMSGLTASTTALAMPPNEPPDSTGPGGELLAQILGWLKYYGLWAAIAALLLGAGAVAIGHFGSNYGAASAGRKFLLGGIAAAVISGMAWGIVDTLYNSTS